jgi:excinuclease UvrABC nuclease subunit
MNIDTLEKILRKKEKIIGVYILRNKDDVILYIGQSTDIQHRVTQHKNKPWKYYQFIIENDSAARGNLESELIIKYNPLYNILTTPVILDYYKGTHVKRKERRELIEELAKRYGKDILTIASCRMIQRLIYKEWGIFTNHNTINNDLKIIRLKNFC